MAVVAARFKTTVSGSFATRFVYLQARRFVSRTRYSVAALLCRPLKERAFFKPVKRQHLFRMIHAACGLLFCAENEADS